MTAPAARKRGKYATSVGGNHDAPSVSAVIGMLNKPGLPWGAARESALFAVFHQDEWMHLSPGAAVERIRTHHAGVWSAKADKGTAVHEMAQRWAAGEAVDCALEHAPYLDALEEFYLEHDPEWLAVERTVVYQAPGLSYGGTPDAFVKIAGRSLVLDIKSGQRYPIETTLQLAAYRHADAFGVYDEAGVLTATEPLPVTDGAVVLYLHDDGTYELLEVPADREAFDIFLALRRAWAWNRDMEAWLKKNPAPTKEGAAA